MSASAMTSAMTPTVTPSVEMNEMTEMNACFRLASRYLRATWSSKGMFMFALAAGELANAECLDSPTRQSHCNFYSLFLINGNSMTSLMDGLLVSSMTSRSMPTPSPAVGGSPYSSARM